MADTFRMAAPFALPERVTEPDLVAKYFLVLADPTRVRILELLRDRDELSVGQLVQALGGSQSKVSNHLACLRWCGFVHTRRDHPSVFYRVADDRVLDLLRLGHALLADNAEHVAACRRVGGSRADACAGDKRRCSGRPARDRAQDRSSPRPASGE